jgi:putative membrane protein insertion efficiency factor
MFKRVAVQLLNVYQRYIRIMVPCSCRFLPSCSEYTKQAILKYGFFQGILKGAKRLSMCHPFSQKTGWDPLV